jgi:hypothetical protein
VKNYCGAEQDTDDGACALHAGYLRLQISTRKLCNTHCFSTVTMVARRRFKVLLFLNCPSCYKHPNGNSDKQISLEYFDTNTPFLHHLLTSVIVQVSCTYLIVTSQTSVESLRPQKFPSTSVEEILLHSHNGFAIGQPSETLCIICTVEAVSTTYESL